MHASAPNQTDDRRVGFNVQFITPDIKQLVNKHDTAKLVHGVDLFQYYGDDNLAEIDFSLEAMVINDEMDRRRKET